MADRLAYAILGRGYWAGRMSRILAEEHRVAQIDGARHKPTESVSGYKARLAESFKESGAQIVWLCVPPGGHILPMTEAALDAGLHVIAEKPWLSSRAETESLLALAAGRNRLVGVHYQYCLLSAVEAWRRTFDQGAGLDFSGHFTTSRPDRVGMDAIDNLGSHLLALREYALPQARTSLIRCGYEMADQRLVWLEKAGERVASVDFLENREPIIQRFIERLEGAVAGAPFAFGVDFALRVAESTELVKRKQRQNEL
jgi:hypothetical protein